MALHQSDRAASDKPFYTLFIGNTDDRPFSAQQRADIFQLVLRHFPSFTALDAQGFYKGKPLPTLQVQVATKDRYSLLALCQELGLYLQQKFIGLSDGQIFQSVAIIEPDQRPQTDGKLPKRDRK